MHVNEKSVKKKKIQASGLCVCMSVCMCRVGGCELVIYFVSFYFYLLATPFLPPKAVNLIKKKTFSDGKRKKKKKSKQ